MASSNSESSHGGTQHAVETTANSDHLPDVFSAELMPLRSAGSLTCNNLMDSFVGMSRRQIIYDIFYIQFSGKKTVQDAQIRQWNDLVGWKLGDWAEACYSPESEGLEVSSHEMWVRMIKTLRVISNEATLAFQRALKQAAFRLEMHYLVLLKREEPNEIGRLVPCHEARWSTLVNQIEGQSQNADPVLLSLVSRSAGVYDTDYDRILRTMIVQPIHGGMNTVYGHAKARRAMKGAITVARNPTTDRRVMPSILLYGPKGVGKSQLPIEIADYHSFTVLRVDCVHLLEGPVSQSIEIILAVFRYAENNRQTVIFFDNLDSISIPARAVQRDIRHPLQSTFMSLWKVCINMEGIVLVAATNKPAYLGNDCIDRFTTQIYMGLPNDDVLCHILQRECRMLRADFSAAVVRNIARNAPVNTSGRDVVMALETLAKLLVRDAKSATSFIKKTVDGRDFYEACSPEHPECITSTFERLSVQNTVRPCVFTEEEVDEAISSLLPENTL